MKIDALAVKTTNPVADDSQNNESTGIATAALLVQKNELDSQILTQLVNASSSVSETPSLGSAAGSLPSWFNDLIPQDIINAFNSFGKDVFSKLYLMLDWMKANPSNTTAPFVFLSFVSNLCKDPKKYAEILKLLNDKTLSNGSISILQSIVALVVKQAYVKNKGNVDQVLKDLSEMFPKDDAISNAIKTQIASLKEMIKYKGFKDLDQYFNNPDAFDVVASGLWGNALKNINILGWKRIARLQAVDNIIGQYKGNPLLMLMVLICMLSDASTANEISGYGASSSYMEKCTKKVADFINRWKAGFTSEDSAKKFIKDMKDFIDEVDNNPIVEQIKAQLKSQFKNILDEKYSYTIPDPKDSTKTIPISESLNDLYTKAMNGDAESSKRLFEALKSFHTLPTPTKENPNPTFPAAYQSIFDSLKSATSIVSDVSQTITMKMQQLTNQNQVNNNMLNKFLNDSSGIAGLINFAVHKQIPG